VNYSLNTSIVKEGLESSLPSPTTSDEAFQDHMQLVWRHPNPLSLVVNNTVDTHALAKTTKKTGLTQVDRISWKLLKECDTVDLPFFFETYVSSPYMLRTFK
jgi:hypothetical protein